MPTATKTSFSPARRVHALSNGRSSRTATPGPFCLPSRSDDATMETPNQSHTPRFVVANLRWWIGGLLFASTVINYIDRQTLNVLAPKLQAEYHWTNSDFAMIVIAFRISYSVVQLI